MAPRERKDELPKGILLAGKLLSKYFQFIIFSHCAGLAGFEAGNSLELSPDGLISSSVMGGISVAQNIFIFLFAAVALDFCFKMRIVSPFPMKD